MQELFRENFSFKIEINIICLIILFFLFRTAIPLFKYPFILLFFCISIYSIVKFRHSLFKQVIEFIREYYLLIILVGTLVIGFFLSNKIYLSVFKEIINTIILFFIFLLMKLIIVKRNELSFFANNLVNLVILFALVISVYLLGTSFNIFSDTKAFTATASTSSIITNKSIDNNFALLPIFFGLIGIFYLLLKPISFLRKVIYNLTLIVYSLSIFFSGSRRGFLLLLCITGLLVFIQLLSFIIKNSIIQTISKTTLYFIISLLILSGCFYYFTFNTKFLFKSRVIEFIGSKNILATKQRIAFSLYRYGSIFNFKSTYDTFYNVIWSASLDIKDHNTNFDPKDPESIWGTRIHKIVFPLIGENVEIVPSGSKGYLMDSTCNSDTWNGNAYSYTLIGKRLVTENNIVSASVYCYVSKDFNGTWAMIYSSDAAKGENRYDLENKGKWQKLNLKLYCEEGEAFVFLYFSKFGVTDFSTLKGYVIFAYPKVEILGDNNSSGSSYNAPVIIENNNNRVLDKCAADKKIITNSNSFSTYTAWSGHTKYLSSGIFSLPLMLENKTDSMISDKDPIRNWVAKFISEDTTYYNYKKELFADTISNNFIGPRIMRWQFGWQIFSKENNWKQKLFGGGFDFLNWYGYYFEKNTRKSDYPHNPFISILLYSGIFGLVIYIIFIFKVFYFYFKYFKEYKLLSIFFVITFGFSFFSGGNPFDPPIMGFFVMLPFFIHYIHEKNKPELISK